MSLQQGFYCLRLCCPVYQNVSNDNNPAAANAGAVPLILLPGHAVGGGKNREAKELERDIENINAFRAAKPRPFVIRLLAQCARSL